MIFKNLILFKNVSYLHHLKLYAICNINKNLKITTTYIEIMIINDYLKFSNYFLDFRAVYGGKLIH